MRQHADCSIPARVRARRYFSSVLSAVWLLAVPALAQTPPAEVQLVAVQRGPINRYVPLPGNLVPNRQVALYPKVAGYLRTVNVDKGDAVRAGQVLAEVEVPELLADRGRYRAEVEVAELALKRIEAAQARAPDLIVPAAADEAQARYKIAKANLQRAETLLGYTQITAPFAGTVAMRFADPGAFVAAPAASALAADAGLFTLVDASVIRVRLMVPEAEAARVRPGQPVTVMVEGSAREWTASVSRIARTLDEQTRTMLVECDVPNADGALLPGMYARVRIGVEQHGDALLLPLDAVLFEKAAASVFVVADGKLRKQPFTAGFNDGRQVEVLKGLESGQSVVRIGKQALVSGQPVRVVAAP